MTQQGFIQELGGWDCFQGLDEKVYERLSVPINSNNPVPVITDGAAERGDVISARVSNDFEFVSGTMRMATGGVRRPFRMRLDDFFAAVGRWIEEENDAPFCMPWDANRSEDR